ncbi:MAG: SDR family NAD(P)-dependent oxidoreductase [Novosphingobium sp.]|nr:SDR family NAD(P)-dependent oxidoreductase [Novosphingobium sp.]
MMRFDGKVAIVSGGGRGVGRAHAEELAARGCKVVINDAGLDPTGRTGEGVDPAEQAAQAIRAAGGEAVSHKGDVRTCGPDLVARALDEWGRLDVVICNAGGSHGGLLADMSAADWHNAFDIHLVGTVDLVRSAWPHLVASGAGRILTTGSNGMFGNAHATSYGAAKAAIFGFTRGISLEGAPLGIHANCILPSAWSRLTAKIQDPFATDLLENRFGPEHIARFAAWLVHESCAVNGEGFMVGGGVAQRMNFALGEHVVLDAPEAEDWAKQERALMDSPVSPAGTLIDSFAAQILALDPSLADQVEAMRTGGVNTKDGKVEETAR